MRERYKMLLSAPLWAPAVGLVLVLWSFKTLNQVPIYAKEFWDIIVWAWEN